MNTFQLISSPLALHPSAKLIHLSLHSLRLPVPAFPPCHINHSNLVSQPLEHFSILFFSRLINLSILFFSFLTFKPSTPSSRGYKSLVQLHYSSKATHIFCYFKLICSARVIRFPPFALDSISKCNVHIYFITPRTNLAAAERISSASLPIASHNKAIGFLPVCSLLTARSQTNLVSIRGDLRALHLPSSLLGLRSSGWNFHLWRFNWNFSSYLRRTFYFFSVNLRASETNVRWRLEHF